MGLDINTEKGQQSLVHEREVQDIISKKWNVTIIETPKESSAACDGFLIRNGEIIAVFETKCRYDMSYELFMERGSWLITMDKISKGRILSTLLRVPFIGFLYLMPKSNPDEKVLMFTKITDNVGEYCYKFEKGIQPTQRTINGGEAMRMNAYIPANQLSVV